ncbi:DUF4082 domain-containing protein [Nonomuraea sp. LPB2021202275-12-8]|uniref:DUF4082 domain-containing protein n=1 Tax=Nonomuraea sp. LPB2021202275-12-8 TaxID=3120159 RepID=UPI00300CDA1C
MNGLHHAGRYAAKSEPEDAAKSRRLPLRRSVLTAIAAVMLASAAVIAAPASAFPGQPGATVKAADESVWSPTSVLPARLARAGRPVELGMRFTATRPGTVTAIRFHRHRRAAGTHTASLWDGNGNRLAHVPFAAETASGWQEVRLPRPVAVSANRPYIVSYHVPDGVFGLVRHYFQRYSPGTDSLRVSRRNGVYTYDASAFPRRTSAGHNYLVDVVFRPGTSTPTPSTASSPTPSVIPTRSVTPTMTPTMTPTTTVTPSPSRSVTPTPTVSPSDPPATTTPTPSTPGRPGCDLPSYPTPDCTGAPAGARLSATKGNVTVTKPGQVIDGLHITGDLIVAADDVVIRNSRIDGLITNWETGGSFTITDSTVGPPTGCRIYPAIGEKNFTAERVHIRGFDDGFRMSGRNVTVRDSYVHLCGPPTSHSDGIQAYCPGSIVCSGLVFDHNTVDQRQAPEHSDPINLVDKNLSDVTVTDNLLAGGNYTLFLEWRSGPKWKISGNKIVHGAWDFGPVSSADTCENIDWGPGNAIVTIDRNYQITKTVEQLTRCIE